MLTFPQQPSAASPHRLVLIADPQLVDPHTYPGRPWPLSSLTIFYTDLYLKRSYTILQRTLSPDSVIFLGDLFDGGREWSTTASSSPEERYRQYGNSYWMREYLRFSRIFFDAFNNGGLLPLSSATRSRKLIASLPGNHDLGFASGIQLPVKKRFEAYFGPGNRLDLLGNHTFISIDTVSLSAMGQADPATGSSGAGDGTSASSPPLSDIWATTEDFLTDLKSVRTRAITTELRRFFSAPDANHYTGDGGVGHKYLSRFDVPGSVSPTSRIPSPFPAISSSQFPTIILSHVPFHRPPDSDCGPLRERGSSISITAGYQYQNVLTPFISSDIIEKIGPAEDIAHIYSGDDHDFCEWTHTEFTGGIKETTVKSMSAAMGVRRPGFLAVSLWNPVNLDADELVSPKDTIQENLCLLPDMLNIFTRYAYLLIFTVITIFTITIRERRRNLPSEDTAAPPILPLSNIYSDGHLSKRNKSPAPIDTKSSSLPEMSQSLSSRCTTRPSRYHGPVLGGYGNIPASSRSSSPSKSRHHHQNFREDLNEPNKDARIGGMAHDVWDTSRKPRKRRSLLKHFGWNLWMVAWPILLWYFWLLWHG